MNLLTIDDISQMLQLSRDYVRDRLVKKSDFPRPCLSLSQKNRRWDKVSVDNWLNQNKANLLR